MVIGPVSFPVRVTERRSRAVSMAPVTAISMGINRSSPVWVNSMISTIAQSGARWVVARTDAAPISANAEVGAPGRSRTQRFPGHCTQQCAGRDGRGEQPARAPLPRQAAVARGLRISRMPKSAHAQGAVEGELCRYLPVAQQGRKADGQRTNSGEHDRGRDRQPPTGLRCPATGPRREQHEARPDHPGDRAEDHRPDQDGCVGVDRWYRVVS